MAVSAFDLLKIGTGPSSSHTAGPMHAVLMFASGLEADGLMPQVASARVELYDSLGATGKGHGADHGVILGLMGEAPDAIDPDAIDTKPAALRASQSLSLPGRHMVRFTEKKHIAFYRREAMVEHPNDVKFYTFGTAGERPHGARYLSVGGGFVVTAGAPNTQVLAAHDQLLHPFRSGKELLTMCESTGKSITRLMLEDELTWHSEAGVCADLSNTWHVMQACVARGCHTEGELSDPFHVRRRAAELYSRFTMQTERTLSDPLSVIDWVNLYAIAVNKENAAGGHVVTAPTSDAARIIPAVVHYCDRFVPGANDNGVVDFLLIAGAIGMLCKMNVSISGAEVGCQGEVGVACSIVAGALATVLGGTPAQVENAAEIGMEHNLGLTCNPVGGLVQIPCIERNAMASVKAMNVTHMVLRGDGTYYISLDSMIKTMRETGTDMKMKYKETARGGLAVSIVDY